MKTSSALICLPLAAAISVAGCPAARGETAPVLAGGLRIGEICPRPDALDPNGRTSGWVELVNCGEEAVDLADYELVRKNRGKAAKAGKPKTNLKSRIVQPGARTLVYTSEEYANCEDLGGSGQVAVFDNDVMVYPAKVNPKKFPYVQLYRGANESDKVLVDEFIVPVDLQDGWSVAPREFADRTERLLLPNATPGAENNLAGAVGYGPNVSPLYGVKHELSDLDPVPLARAGEDYEVTLAVNPALMKLAKEGDAVDAVTLVYSADFGEPRRIAMEKGEFDAKGAGQQWTATIPAADLPAPGGLLRWAAEIETHDGAVWRSPSFKNPDDGYQWYGTIVEEPSLSTALQTFHLFVSGASLVEMDKDVDLQDRAQVPYNARVAVFDSQTGRYYDNVRIDLRGNTSANFWKKSHGLRFAKCNPLVCVNPFTGEALEVRKTSFVAEFTDPTNLRQSLAMTFFHNRADAYAPFGYPVRLNLNGQFYQVATHSNRFTDEMIEDWYGFDPMGYGYKNVGRITPQLEGGVTIEKKTPDDGDETSPEAMAPLKAFAQDIVDDSFGPGVVVREMDLPAWINYLAAARITHETDDVWSNISIYGDLNGTGTWIPLAYDMNQSWGHVYWSSWGGARDGAHADRDQHKSHPLYGGTTIVAHDYWGNAAVGNNAIETVYRHPKFRRMYLRRLRTLMDAYLREPGTPKEETPVWQDFVAFTNAASADIALDYAKWRSNPDGNEWTDWSKTYIYCWDHPLTFSEGVEDLWENYIVRRRTHLYVTHSVTNTAKAIGYGTNLNAGIPLAQSPIFALRAKITIPSVDTKAGTLVIRNDNDEAVDMSGWRLSGATDFTLPGGTVVDAGDALTLVADRKAYVAARAGTLSDEFIVGNASFTGPEKAVLATADGEIVAAAVPVAVDVVAGVDFTNVTFTVEAADLIAANGLTGDGVRFVLTLAEGSAEAVPGADGRVAFTVPAPAGSTFAYTITATGADGGELAVGFAKSDEADAARVERWYDSAAEGDGEWTRTTLPADGADHVLRVYTPVREQPTDEVILDSDFTVHGDQTLDDLPDAGASIVNFTCFDGSWQLLTAEGWTALSAPGAEVVEGSTYAVRIRYDGRAGTVAVAIRSGGAYQTLSDGSSRAVFPIRGESRPVQSIASLGDYPNERLVGRSVSAMIARVGDTDYATIAEALDAARAAGTRRIILLWPATLPRGYAAVTRDGVTRLLKLGTSIRVR